MAQRRGGQTQWQRQLANERREAERRNREAVRLAKEQARQERQQHLDRQQQTADSETARIEREVRALNDILKEALSEKALSFSDLHIQTALPIFDPGPYCEAAPRPHWDDFAPKAPGAVGRIFGGKERHARRSLDAERVFNSAVSAWEQQESQRLQELAALQDAYERSRAEIAAEDEAFNRKIDACEVRYLQGESEAVEWFVRAVMQRSRYPWSQTEPMVAYRPENRDLVVEMELPEQQVIPNVRSYRFIRTRDAIDPVPRSQAEIRERYARLISCVALRTLNEIFSSTSPHVVEAVNFNGRLTATDRATGKHIRPHLLSVQAERGAFEDLILDQVEPAACLKHLNALVSPNPFDLEAVDPFIAFDLSKFRFMDGLDVVAKLDSRANLMKLTPTEFEHLVRQLFEAMGAESWNTIPSKDGGVDAVATSKNLFFGGVCLIQAKRYTGLVGLESVHALTGVMADHNATTGVLVTTSWFGRASEQFAKRNRVTLINGAELKSLIKKHLDRDVIPGTNPPRRLGPSDNTQTGRD